MSNEVMKESNKLVPVVMKWFFIIMIISIIFLKFFAPMFKDYRRETIQHSHGYVETKRSLLLDLLSDWNALESELAGDLSPPATAAKLAQQAGVARQMHEEAERLPESEIPRSVATFFNKRR